MKEWIEVIVLVFSWFFSLFTDTHFIWWPFCFVFGGVFIALTSVIWGMPFWLIALAIVKIREEYLKKEL